MRLYPNKTHIPLTCIKSDLSIEYIDDLKTGYRDYWNKSSFGRLGITKFRTKKELITNLDTEHYIPEMRIKTTRSNYLRITGLFAKISYSYGGFYSAEITSIYPIVLIALKRSSFVSEITKEVMDNPDNFDIFVTEESIFASKICKNYGFDYRKRTLRVFSNLISDFSGYKPNLTQLRLETKASLSSEFMSITQSRLQNSEVVSS